MSLRLLNQFSLNDTLIHQLIELISSLFTKYRFHLIEVQSTRNMWYRDNVVSYLDIKNLLKLSSTIRAG